MSAAAVARVAEAIGPHVAELMAAVEARLSAVAADTGAALAEPAGDTIAAGGKRLRPLLVFLAAGDEPRETDALVRAAVAVELIHSATLVHDDVLDAADLRRGRPTVFATNGRALATSVGDALFARAFAEVARPGRTEQVRILSAASSALAEGELLQRADAWDVGVPLDRYLHRCELKTSSLFSAACELGAVDGPADPVALAAFGRRIGLAFQLLDDVLDVSGPAARTGKARGTDLLDGTVTLPLIVARERDASLARIDLRTEVTTPEQAEAVSDAIAATGALDAARDRALGGRRRGQARSCPPACLERQRLALELVADGVGRTRLLLSSSLEVHRQDRVGLEGRGEAGDRVLHVGLGQAAQVGHELLGAEIELLLEGLDLRLVEDPVRHRLALGAAQRELPVVVAGLLPVRRVDERRLAAATGPDRGDRRLGGHVVLDGVLVEVHHLDRLARGQDDAADGVSIGVAHDGRGSLVHSIGRTCGVLEGDSTGDRCRDGQVGRG